MKPAVSGQNTGVSTWQVVVGSSEGLQFCLAQSKVFWGGGWCHSGVLTMASCRHSRSDGTKLNMRSELHDTDVFKHKLVWVDEMATLWQS